MGVSYTTRRWRKAFLTIFTQNCRGLKTDARIRAAWRAMLKSGEPPPEYRARPPTPAALPISYTRARRSTAAATNIKIDRDVRTLRDITNIA